MPGHVLYLDKKVAGVSKEAVAILSDRELGIDPGRLFRKIKSSGIELPEKDGRS